MKQKPTLILTRANIQNLIDAKSSIIAVEKAFAAFANHKTQMPSKIYLNLPQYHGDFRAMPAFVENMGASVKWVNVHAKNKNIKLPTVMAVIVLSDPKTGFPLVIMDGTLITSLRTAAAGAVAAKYLARRDSSVVGLVGCGVQARSQLEALRTLFKIKEVRVWGHEKSFVKAFIQEMKKRDEIMMPAKDIKQAVLGPDIVVTTTPSRKPLVSADWISPGTHINAIGADAKGKQEIDMKLFKRAKIVIDDWDQASHSGEINVAVHCKIISQKDIHAQIGDIVLKRKTGRTTDKEITIFDSTGLAIQDTALAHLVYTTAVKKNIGRKINLI